MNDFLLSVIIPVYNRNDVVIRTLDSVKAQSYRPLKLILVDNDSTDGSLFTLLHWSSLNRSEDFVVEVASESDEGAAAARNAGLRLADTPWVMFFDSDDVMQPDHIFTALDTLAMNPYADIVGWDVNIHMPGDKVVRRKFAVRDCLYNCILDGTMSTLRYMVKKSILMTAGAWNPTVRVWDDIELGSRLLLLPSLEIVKRRGDVLVDVYPSDESVSGTNYLDRSERLEHALEVMADNLPVHSRFIVYLKGAILAGLYSREGGIAQADALMARILEREVSVKRRWLYNFARYYTERGGRGVAKILKYFL